jgi:CubicO group peptidase (beta-lactamase class C family)
VYASCGFLHEDSSKLHFALLPDNRDVFDLASLTKALVTTPLAIWFCQRASHELNSSSLNAVFGCTAVESLWPEAGKISLADLLRHESGLPAWRNFYVECEGQRQTIEDVLTRLGKAPAQNGTPKDVYSDIGFILLGRLLEKAGGNKLIEQWWEACDQEGIKSARKLGWQGSLTPRHAISTGYCPVRQKNLVGEVHDENCWALGGFAGHAGLFGAGQDVEAFLKDLWSTSAGQDVFQANFAQISSASATAARPAMAPSAARTTIT